MWGFWASARLVSCRAKATYFGDFSDFRCLFSFLPAVKAADFAGFPFLGCLLATILALKATYFGDFPDFRCLFSFLPAVKASDFAGFPFFGCLWATILAKKATYFGDFTDLRCLSFFFRTKKECLSTFFLVAGKGFEPPTPRV